MLKTGPARWITIRSLFILAASSFPGVSLFGQPNRITENITNGQRFTLSGNINPNARAEYDQGPADASLLVE